MTWMMYLNLKLLHINSLSLTVMTWMMIPQLDVAHKAFDSDDLDDVPQLEHKLTVMTWMMYLNLNIN